MRNDLSSQDSPSYNQKPQGRAHGVYRRVYELEQAELVFLCRLTRNSPHHTISMARSISFRRLELHSFLKVLSFCNFCSRASIISEIVSYRNPLILGRKVPNVSRHYLNLLTFIINYVIISKEILYKEGETLQ